MYGAAITAVSCLRAGTEAHVAWVVDSSGLPEFDPTEVLTLTAGGARLGSLANGSLNAHVEFIAGATRGRLVDIVLTGTDALIAAVPDGGRATIAIAPAAALPDDLWGMLFERRPVALSARIDAGTLVDFEVVDSANLELGVTTSTRSDDRLVTTFVPVARLAIFGGGAIVEALTSGAELLGWQCASTNDVDHAIGLMNSLSPLDSAVIMGHDVESSSRVLEAALESAAGYIGSIGAPRMQQQRADWLAYRGVTDLSRVHGPAGIDIGATTPAEIAISILAEAVHIHHRPERDSDSE